MFILLTNDDGIYSSGINILYNTLAKEHKVIIIAPENEMSATSHSISLHTPLRARKIDETHYAINGTPTDCINLALFHILRKTPDLIISGINQGPNLGTDVTYSGTVAAALEGAILGIKSIAASCIDYRVKDLSAHSQFIRYFIKNISRKSPLFNGTFININMPPVVKGPPYSIAVTRLSSRRYDKVIEKRRDPRGREYFWIAGEPMNTDNGKGTDVYALNHNQISITPVKVDMTDKTRIAHLRKYIKGLRF
ncbi:MAG: 5'/3'-nucleotidase SurE [Deltaproteobacteria bacterium]|nr:5'/3'-nucleotidase SurE [Deltaproteobacteria bacterium]